MGLLLLSSSFTSDGSPSPSPDVSLVVSPWTIEAEETGRGNGWTEWTEDVVVASDLRFQYGINGNGPSDLVASPGTFTLALDNSDYGGRTAGQFSPNHANRKAGFSEGMGIRLSIQVGDFPRRYKFVGTVDSIIPVAGSWGQRITLLTVTDWMDYASYTKASGLGIQTNKRSDELFALLVASLAVQPRGLQITAGKDTYPFAFDNLQSEGRSVLAELNRLAQSERGRIYIKGDTVQGGTLTFEPRGYRFVTTTNVDVFEDEDALVGLTAPYERAQIVNHAQVITNQRRRGETDAEVLYDSQVRIAVEPQSTLSLFAPYRDPLNEAERVAAIDVQDIGSPGSPPTYSATSNEDGTGDDLTAFVTLDIGDDGNGAHVEIENTASVKAWVDFQILGRGLYTYRTTVAEYTDTASVGVRGTRTATINMPYQSSVAVASSVAKYIVQLFTSAQALPVIEFVVGYDEEDLLDRVMRREISDRIGIVEQVTGLSTTTSSPVVRGYFINAIECRIVDDTHVRVRWTLSPADTTNYWRLGVSGSSNVGLMMVAPGQIIGHGDQVHGDSAHVDVAHGDTEHSDTAHADTAHLDHSDGAGSHEDDAHQDSAHVDTAHSDSAHSDSVHTDSAHIDIAHSDSAHGDQAHTDEAHEDIAHGDLGHQDTAHSDTAYSDTAHADEEHVDTDHVDTFDDIFEHFDHGDEEHGDEAHLDDAHVDVAHVDAVHADAAHNDSDHTDQPFQDSAAHVDNAHSDSAHSDTTHGDTAHGDSHGDTAHADTGHADAAHVDHTDASHGDTAHLDTAHVDTAHSDSDHSDTAHADAPHVDD